MMAGQAAGRKREVKIFQQGHSLQSVVQELRRGGSTAFRWFYNEGTPPLSAPPGARSAAASCSSTSTNVTTVAKRSDHSCRSVSGSRNFGRRKGCENRHHAIDCSVDIIGKPDRFRRGSLNDRVGFR